MNVCNNVNNNLDCSGCNVDDSSSASDCMQSHFSDEKYCLTKIPLAVLSETINYVSNEKKITAKFNYDLTYYNYKINLFVILNNGKTFIKINYDNFQIVNSIITINGINLPEGVSSFDRIQVDLSPIQAHTLSGGNLENPIFSVDSSSSQSSSFSSIQGFVDTINGISSFLSKNRYNKIANQ